jgi:cephalosporin hydroxylase
MNVDAMNIVNDPMRQTLFGITIQQTWTDLWLWEVFFNTYNHVHTIIEIGTKYGGLSFYFKMQAEMRGKKFHTFDIEPCPHPWLEPHFVHGNVFDDGGSRMRQLLNESLHPLLLLCDGGDKQMEFKMFVPMLQNGDYIAVHDWGSEFWDSSVTPVRDMVTMRMERQCTYLSSMTRFWERT